MRQMKKKIFALMGACIIMSGITAYAEDFYNPVYSDPFNNDLFEIVSEVKFSDEIKKECPDIMRGGTADAGFTVFQYNIVSVPGSEQSYDMKYTNIKIDYDGNAYITSREKLNNNGTGEITEPQDGIVKDGLGEYHVVIGNEVDPNYNDMRSEFKDINGNLVASLSDWYAVIKYTCGVINVVRDMNSGTLSGDEITYILNPWEANKEYYFKGAIYEFDDNGYAIYNPNNLQECTTDDKYYVIKLKRGIIPSVSYNGEKITFDQIPVIENGRTLVPLRAIFEKIGTEVTWNGDTQTVTAKSGDTEISLTINNTTAYKNGEFVTLDVPAKIINGRTLVPVRFIADCFGVEVNWDGVMQRVSLTSK